MCEIQSNLLTKKAEVSVPPLSLIMDSRTSTAHYALAPSLPCRHAHSLPSPCKPCLSALGRLSVPSCVVSFDQPPTHRCINGMPICSPLALSQAPQTCSYIIILFSGFTCHFSLYFNVFSPLVRMRSPVQIRSSAPTETPLWKTQGCFFLVLLLGF